MQGHAGVGSLATAERGASSQEWAVPATREFPSGNAPKAPPVSGRTDSFSFQTPGESENVGWLTVPMAGRPREAGLGGSSLGGLLCPAVPPPLAICRGVKQPSGEDAVVLYRVCCVPFLQDWVSLEITNHRGHRWLLITLGTWDVEL